MTTILPELLDHLYIAQEHDIMLGGYYLLAHSTDTDYYLLYNLIIEFLMFKV